MNFSDIKKIKSKYLFSVLIVLILIVAIIVVFAVTYNNNNSNNVNTDNNESVGYEDNDNTFAGDSSILFVCNGDEIGDAVFSMLIEFRIYSETVNLTLLNMNTVSNTQTYSDSYRYGGIDSLINSIKTVRNCEIDKYMIIDKSGIGKITDKLGSVNLYVNESFTYAASDKSYEISAGNNDLESDALYTYLSILSNNSDTDKLKNTICEIIELYISKINTDNSEMIFGEICNSVVTNMTISDYYTSKNDFHYLLAHNPKYNLTDDIEK